MAQLQDQQLSLGTAYSAPVPSRTRANTMCSLRSKKRKKRRKRKSATPKASNSSRIRNFKERPIPRKLGPRDMGRNKYKQGTKYEETQTYGTFLDEKLHRHARTSSFLTRKAKNPVPKRETVEETGRPNDWKKPQYYKSETQKMYSYHNARRQGWGGSMQFLREKPSKPKDSRLEALKDTKIPKGKSVRAYGSPHSWKPIQFKYENTGGGFLDEKFWFEGSHVQMDGGLSRLIEALSPEQKLKLNKLPAPTGYQSKINFLKMLRDLVMIEVNRIDKEDKALKKIENQAFINEMSEEIEKELEKQLDEALVEVLEDYETDDQNVDDVEEQKQDMVTLQLDVIYDDEEDIEIENEKDEMINGAEFGDDKHKNLLQRKKSSMGMLQRQLLTMKSVNKLTHLIDGMEKPQSD